MKKFKKKLQGKISNVQLILNNVKLLEIYFYLKKET